MNSARTCPSVTERRTTRTNPALFRIIMGAALLRRFRVQENRGFNKNKIG